jgi:hypothetical protein
MGLYIVEFNLTKRSPLTVENGDVIVDKGYDTVTVRNVQALSIDDAKIKAEPIANEFLNELCYQHEIKLELGNGCTMMLQQSPDIRHIKRYRIRVFTTGGHKKRTLVY